MRIVPAPKRAKTQSDLPVCTARHAVDLPYFHGHNGTTVWARRLDDFANRAHGCVVPQPDLRLANLTTDGLHRLKLPKAELIASAPHPSITWTRHAGPRPSITSIPTRTAWSGCRGSVIVTTR